MKVKVTNMNWSFKLWTAMTGFLLIKVHFVIALLIAIISIKTFNIEMIGNVLFIIYLAIAAIGHVRGTINCYKEMENPDLFKVEEPEDIDDAFNPNKNMGLKAMIWRFQTEWKYMKKTFNFDFKKAQ